MSRAAFPTFPSHYRERFVAQGLWLDRTLHDYFDETAARLPTSIALVEGEKRVSFARWQEDAARLAAGLLRLGIGKGDIVSVQLPNWYEMCLLQIALSRIGAVIQPMHMVYREREIESMLRFCDSRAVILPGEYRGFDHAGAVRAVRAKLPDLELVITARGDGDLRFDELLRGEPAASGDCPVVSADDVFYLNFTSGTEGNPKGFLHTHNTLLSVLKRFADLQRQYDPGSDADVVLANSPMSHSFGHLSTYQVLLRGIRMVLVERFDAGETLKIIARDRVTSVSGTPAHLIGLLHHPTFASTDTSSVKSVGVGGAQCPPQLMADIERHFRVSIGNTYGMGENIVHTRTSPGDPPDVIRDTVGKPVPGAELKIFADDHASELAVGEVGEIAFRGPTLFLGYYKNPERTRETRNDEGWFFTGDLGFVDDRGYLHLAGRKKDMINRGGSKIYPKEVEDLLHSHPAVLRAAVVGMPDYRLGERVCAYVELQPGASLDLDEVKLFLSEQRVMRYKIPERLEIVDALPMTPTGKVKKDPLIEDIRKKLGATAD